MRTCRGCGCTDSRACPDGCAWLLLDVETPTGVCSRCAARLDFRPDLLAHIGVSFTFDDLVEEEPPSRLVLA